MSAEERSQADVTAGLDASGAGTVIGRYHLLQRIGEGGMGEVWLAEQREPVRRRVALKLVKAGMNTREVMARFESERQALALMDHPAIAKVFDAGSTAQGTPYFVMEYVAGVPIIAYCDHHRLSTRERLELFIHVCEGVQHAHQKAIIHRDLKPSNILVTEVDGHPAPKIIDFGVAKALSQRLTEQTLYTRAGTLVGTPEYMSPEQALSSGEDIDTRTDVYSLGIIFYELLAGAPPLELRKIAWDEFLRRLREEEPPKPSTKIRTQDAATSTELARRRHTEPLAWVKQLRGDLDSIALKALEKERSRRYGSPSDFAADIGRYLSNEAVLAIPPSVAYRARKFARRYRGALVTVGAFALVLIAAAVISIRQSIRANHEAAAAQAVNDFLQNDLLAQASAANQSGPSAKPDPDMKVRTALDRAAARIGGKFRGQPEVVAAIRDTIGQTYADLGLYPEARTQLERAL
ncbi:MAG TPA: protein kinase, partial [Terriglobia bacterium]|nr:protein kinase [Terriglobia bacterium]